MTPRLLLLDSASLYFRAFFGVPDRRTRPGEPPTNAVRGFLDMIATLVERERPTDLVACWDDDWRPEFRVSAIPSYKAHRVSEDGGEEVPEDLNVQVPVIVEVLAALGICRLGVPGYEADDVIGTLVHTRRGSGPIDVVTGDRDLFQLADDANSVRILYTAKGGVRDPQIVDQSYLQSAYGVATGQAYADMAVLRGDTSDGLPGVAGIGEKTAAQLIAQYGTLAGVRAALADGDPQIKGARRTRLEEAAAYLDVAPAVVQVAPDAPLPADLDTSLPAAPRDPEALADLVETYGLGSPARRVVAALARD
ncbi:5'-3' exonuclease [Calidifontibacter sp. DB0510]|uniref:5'-3' exonuclease n=1 Tax=Metallococcus carri TaxID=1656884 RepID=A0A967EDJ8_9MICO|nr:5'-3' exonuclease [Metallococcus carri]NHN54796.1 5'-3' exonuclease [Metallococcus carri]NOP37141.1 5'-3' exonuclease [Calidifontibacter sp. DB2511S]